ncbi:MAG: hypothetical protein IPL61_37235 [Myxococcales bacterium]|nr:hypothetical protein [Myxococcales bacterium]
MITARPWLAAPLLVVIACGGSDGGSTDVEPTLVFADRTDLEITRLINAAGGVDMFSAESVIGQFGDTFDPDPCPAITVAGTVATITGGCTRADGVRVEGTATAENPLGWDQLDYRYSDDTLYTFQQLSFGDAQATQIFDGSLRRADGLTTWDADLTVTSFGLTIRSDLYYHCTDPNNPRCALTNSGLELTGAGGALASGRVSIDRTTNRQTMDFTLKGRDTLTMHSNGTCVGWQIEGTDRGMPCP